MERAGGTQILACGRDDFATRWYGRDFFPSNSNYRCHARWFWPFIQAVRLRTPENDWRSLEACLPLAIPTSFSSPFSSARSGSVDGEGSDGTVEGFRWMGRGRETSDDAEGVAEPV